VWATVEEVTLSPPPHSVTVVVADIDDSKLTTAAIHVASQGKVRLAKRRAPAPTVL
jgi:hypothetical protein